MYGSRSKIPSKNLVHIYLYNVKFLTLLGAPYIYDISSLWDLKEEDVFHVGSLTAVSLSGLSKNKNTKKTTWL
jgi:hypothetical protein